MELQLRPMSARFHPLVGPVSRKRGVAGLRGLGAPSNINPTTIWTPQSGYNVGGGSTAYQAPAQVAVPACASSPDANTADSAECQAQLMAAQRQNLAADTGANLTVDQNVCESNYAENAAAYAALGISPPPNTCMEQTYGLVPADTTGGVNILAGNATQYLTSTTPIAPTAPIITAGGSNTPTYTPGAAQFSFTNLTSGNNSSFNVGDRWQIQISGAAPNSPVAVRGGQNGANVTSTMGTTDSTGSWSYNGQMTQAQVGPWSETWTVGGAQVGPSFSFTVNPAPGTAAATGGSVTGSMSDLLSASTTVGGTSIPDIALIAAGLVVLFLVMKK